MQRATKIGHPPAIETPSFEALFEAHVAGVWRALRRLGVREAEVEDVAQEVFLTVHRKLPEFEGRSKPSTWIYGICVRKASEHRRLARVRYETAHEDLPDAGAPATQEGEVEARRARALLDAILAELDDDKRAVFVLFEIEQLSMADVAEAVSCPVQTAYKRYYAAKAHVAAAVKRAARRGRTAP